MASDKDAQSGYVLKTSSLKLLIYLLGGELVLAYLIPPNILSSAQSLSLFVEAMSIFAPIIDKIQPPYAPNPGPVKFYLAVTLLLFPVKVWIFYVLLNSDRFGLYRHLVVSTETESSPDSPVDFVTEPLRQEKDVPPSGKSRSWLSRILWAVIILVISMAILWSAMVGYPIKDPSNKAAMAYNSLGAGGITMWLQWVIIHLLLPSLLVAVCINIVRDFLITVIRMFKVIVLRVSS
ncbi:MAG: hypothetical protein OQL16_07020 [Gammaproteobacteria bacterium]|nr:hypothetical protein [Gammaproteobacteria bacterium]